METGAESLPGREARPARARGGRARPYLSIGSKCWLAPWAPLRAPQTLALICSLFRPLASPLRCPPPHLAQTLRKPL